MEINLANVFFESIYSGKLRSFYRTYLSFLYALLYEKETE